MKFWLHLYLTSIFNTHVPFSWREHSVYLSANVSKLFQNCGLYMYYNSSTLEKFIKIMYKHGGKGKQTNYVKDN